MQHQRISLTAMMLAVALVALFPLSAVAQPAFDLQPFRPYDQTEGYLFEAPQVEPVVTTDGMPIYIGAAFAQQFQMLDHESAYDDVAATPLVDLYPGFNLATANLYLGAELTPGVRVNLATYLSSRHHPEAWVKGGYLLVDAAPFLGSETIDNLMEYLTLRVGHFEINYGDAHFRRTDNGMALYNPFVGNYIMDSFTTEVGSEVYFRSNGALAMLGVTSGQLNPGVVGLEDHTPSVYGKLGYDSQVNEDLRLRLTGSVYYTGETARNTLYGGDRAGSRYYDILVTEPGASFTNARINPNFRNEITAVQINPFVKFQGLELFGLIETASGKAADEPESRTWNQFAVDALYRFLPREQVYVGGRYNIASGELAGLEDEVSSQRIAIGGGWFPTPNILLKLEYVNQQYNDYPAASLFHEASFDGFVIEGVVAF